MRQQHPALPDTADRGRCDRPMRQEIRTVRMRCHHYAVTVVRTKQEAAGHD
ncbi:MAG TPA: hypothetical protein PLP43_07310 [Methanoculleus sp.]|nr:hypothetical protein [Methanoculleus sp.]